MFRRVAFILSVLMAGCSAGSLQPPSYQHLALPASSVAQPDAATNLVFNSGFEGPMNAGVVTCGALSPSIGNWLPYAQPNGSLPITENSVVHAGKLSLEVHTPAAPGGCGGDAIYQDINSFPAATSYTFSYWVFPALGEENQSIFFGWHAGPPFPSHDVLVSPTQTVFDAWGQSKAVAAVSYGSWHQFILTVDAVTLTATLGVDRRSVGTTPPGSPQAAMPATVYLGQENGAPQAADHFYYDSVLLDASPHPKRANPLSVHQGLTHQKVTLAGANFSPSATVAVSGTGVTVTSTTVMTASKIVLYVDVDPSAPLGARDLSVTTAGGMGTCIGCMSVQM